MLVLGDSELVVGFCNRKYKPSKKFFNIVGEVRQFARSLPAPVKFRHVYREQNKLADWLANVAKHLPCTTDLTPHLTTDDQLRLTFLSPPPWPAREAPDRLLTR